MGLIGNDWDQVLEEEFNKEYYVQLRAFLTGEYDTATVYPRADEVYSALKLTSYKDVRAVILGQDPYHEPGQAHGLAFSVPASIKFPPSLVNIFKELADDIGEDAIPTAGTGSEGVLLPWARQGVLLLNTSLTVRAHEAGSHRGKGWEQLTDAIIGKLAERELPMVFILWGSNAISKKDIILKASAASGIKHLIISAPHPSPLSAYRGFFGGRYFSRTNYFLEDCGLKPIDWSLNK